MFLVCERVSSIQVFNNKFDGVCLERKVWGQNLKLLFFGTCFKNETFVFSFLVSECSWYTWPLFIGFTMIVIRKFQF
jgi:hypothetical protein